MDGSLPLRAALQPLVLVQHVKIGNMLSLVGLAPVDSLDRPRL